MDGYNTGPRDGESADRWFDLPTPPKLGRIVPGRWRFFDRPEPADGCSDKPESPDEQQEQG